MERALDIHSTNVRLVRKFLRDTDGVSADIGVTPFCLVRYSKGPSSLQLAKAILSKTGVLVAPGDFFGAPRAFRLCLGNDDYSTNRPDISDEFSKCEKRNNVCKDRLHGKD